MTTTTKPTIIWTKVDEAPALATYSLLPIVQAYAGAAGINVETRDISLAGRILVLEPIDVEPLPRPHRRAGACDRAGACRGWG